MPSPSAEQFDIDLNATASRVEAELDRLLPEITGDRLRTAMRYAVLGPGKRLRPYMVLQSASLFDVAPDQALRVAAALECVHCYSLVHDDLPAMDDDDLRRGQPTMHRKFDEATAILAGDALLTFAFEILANEATHLDPAVRSALVLALARGAGEAGMVGGQMLDILADTKGFKSVAEISDMQNMKTGALFRFACEAGAIMAGADGAKLRQYADHVGLAFQIADDILDVESSAKALGKATQKDRTKGKVTFVDLLGLDQAKVEARELIDAASDMVHDFGPKADGLRAAAEFSINRRK